jgi:multidrug efflux pump subunit AcrA (membrane-fusion protein)
VLVKAACPNAGGLYTAQVLKARIIWARHPGLTVPTAVVSRLASQHFVFVARRGAGGVLAKQTPIDVGAIVGNEYVVLGGLSAGDEIVASSLQKIRDEMPIAALPAEGSAANAAPDSH